MGLSLWHLALAFFRVGVLGYGGGPSSIPLVEIEAVDNYHWLTSEQFGQILAVGNALPGPIGPKMAGYIGYKVAGTLGSFVALVALILPSVLAMVLLLQVMAQFRDIPQVKGMIAAIRPVIAVLLGLLVWEFAAKSWSGSGSWVTLGLAAASLTALTWLHIHPALVVVGALAFGALFLA